MELNALREGKFEIWFVRFTDPHTTESVLIDFMKFPEEEFCRAVFESGSGENHIAIERFKPGTMRASSYSFKLRLGPSVFEPDGLRGYVGKKPRIEFDLTYDPRGPGVDYNPPILRRTRLTDMSLVTPALDARFSGILKIGKREYSFSRVPGTQSHYWGRRFYPGWVYLSCNAFDDSDLLFEVNCPQLPLLGQSSGVGFVRYDGTEYSFNSMRAALRNVRLLQDGRGGIWVAELVSWRRKFVFTVTTATQKMVQTFDREGQNIYYTGRADCLCSVYDRWGPAWKKREDARASQTCAAEISMSGQELAQE